jgi:L-lactate permease
MLVQVILAVIPIAWLIISMAVLKMAGYKSCGIGLIISAVEAFAIYGLSLGEVVTGTLEGVIAAVWPICIIIVGAMFLYNMSLRTGSMNVIKKMLASVSNDKRVAALVNGLVALTGNVYPVIAPLIGGIGCFVTGSATSACVMFASLQQNIAQQLGISEAWLIAANSAGATAGKMISPQSIALGVAAIGVPGSDGRIMSRTIGWCALYIVIVCVVCYLGVIL